MSRSSIRGILVGSVALVAAGCNGGQHTDTAGNGTCSSGTYWNGGNDGDELMYPGSDCVTCHAGSNEAPQYTLAGTVMGDYADQNDCNGVAGVTVHVTDADGVVHDLTTNAAGNFFTNAVYTTPFTIELEYQGRTRPMVTPQSVGNCASCHTAVGIGGAPGRVLAP